MSTDKVCQRMAKECIGTRARLPNRIVTHASHDGLRPLGLRTAQQTILVAISLMKSPPPTQIERRLSLEKSTVSRNVERMQRRGWVELVFGQDGRRPWLKP